MAAEIAHLEFILTIGQHGVFDPHAFETTLGFGARLRIGTLASWRAASMRRDLRSRRF